MTDLSIEDQKLLTEFLGECWHETDQRYVCLKCHAHLHYTETRLDFTDWRVVGRLIEKIEYLTIGRNGVIWGVDLAFNAKAAVHYAVIPQLAICLAIAAWLKEKQHD